MPIITINDRKIEVEAGKTVLQTALANGIYIPHYCYHPMLSVVGNCRMCLVEVKGRPKLEISCNLSVSDGLEIYTESEAVKKARKAVLEFLLINHPIDCPICDQAGECYLQDYHFKYSGAPSRFNEEKAHKPKVVDIGAQIKLDDERCVLCTRCVRFCQEVSKTNELTVAGRGDRSFITTAPGQRLDNPYSLNTADICPMGALTSKDFRFKKRVWLLKSTPSICPHCSNGCPMWIDHEYGIMYRWRPRANGNPPILCNEGRLTYKEWQPPTRLKTILMKSEDGLKTVKQALALEKIKDAIAGGNNIVGIASAQSSCEETGAFIKFLPGAQIFMTKRMPENPTEDDIIIKRDKNPNTAYCEKLRLSPVPADISGDVLFIIDSLPPEDMIKIINFKWKFVVQFTHDESLIVPGADVVLPLATFAEADGTFINFKGLPQKFDKAFNAPGEAKSVAEWMERITNDQ